MIKTHKPRGYIWTCPSHFQQSKEIRNIQYDDCTPAFASAICPESDDELSAQERVAKRRRIEKLADDYLNGQPLFISSARPHPVTLRHLVEGNERSRFEQKYTLPTAEELKDAVLEGESTKSRATIKETSRISRPQQRSRRPFRQVVEQTVTEERATSACKQFRQFKPIKVSLEPSTEAVKQAAALRDRRLRRAVSEVPLPVTRTSSDIISDSDNVEPCSEPGSVAQQRAMYSREQPGTEWLLRRQTKLFELSADASFDELNRSSLDISTSPSQAPNPVLKAHGMMLDSNAPHSSADPITGPGPRALAVPKPVNSGRTSLLGSYVEHWECYGASGISDRIPDCSIQPHQIAERYHTAPEPASDRDVAADDSQSKLLRQHGLSPTSRTSRVSTNQAQVEWLTTEVDSTTASPGAEIRRLVQASAKKAGKVPKTTRAKSSGNNKPPGQSRATRRRSAPSTSQAGPSTEVEEDSIQYETSRTGSRAYKIAEDDGTPFMFRKRVARDEASGLEESKDVPHKTSMRRAVKFPSSEDTPEAAHESKNPVTPRVEISSGGDSSASKLSLALADVHLNTLLPDAPLSAGRSSAIKQAIRQEFKDADADVKITRVTDEPASSQVEGLSEARKLSLSSVGALLHHEDDEQASAQAIVENLNNEDARAVVSDVVGQSSPQTQWLGTQAMLAQAHRDFFDSPLKRLGDKDSLDYKTPDASFAFPGSAPPTVHREILPQMSPELAPLPSTQAIMGAWSPWSTIKKPRTRLSEKAAVLPTVTTLPGFAETDGSFHNHAGNDARRRSSPRFSASATNSSASSTRISFSVTKPVSQEHAQEKSRASVETPKSIVERSQSRQGSSFADSVVIAKESVFDTSAGHTLSSSQHAQLLFREDSNVDDTITEMTTEVLCT
ncbi:hypothetical protein LTR78_002249 [Recurvomyces mirabilis]|uniref:Uncharacterized protein n=1 Tax=Recurvomyces mirabilis TaxID=574656 RepID=A0AAE1C4Y5_9PEZI|nr:hypothetical protein LTR78_002249 [Recurvomyces mirabilis]KAK5160704.1 hypothetical protein LTS14_001717 [Recurvomyces mirabilis]